MLPHGGRPAASPRSSTAPPSSSVASQVSGHRDVAGPPPRRQRRELGSSRRVDTVGRAMVATDPACVGRTSAAAPAAAVASRSRPRRGRQRGRETDQRERIDRHRAVDEQVARLCERLVHRHVVLLLTPRPGRPPGPDGAPELLDQRVDLGRDEACSLRLRPATSTTVAPFVVDPRHGPTAGAGCTSSESVRPSDREQRPRAARPPCRGRGHRRRTRTRTKPSKVTCCPVVGTVQVWPTTSACDARAVPSLDGVEAVDDCGTVSSLRLPDQADRNTDGLSARGERGVRAARRRRQRPSAGRTPCSAKRRLGVLHLHDAGRGEVAVLRAGRRPSRGRRRCPAVLDGERRRVAVPDEEDLDAVELERLVDLRRSVVAARHPATRAR